MRHSVLTLEKVMSGFEKSYTPRPHSVRTHHRKPEKIPSLADSARKRHKKGANAKLNKDKTYIGDQFDRWMDLRTKLTIKSNIELAKILMDRYEDKSDSFLPFITSTPGPSMVCNDSQSTRWTT
ncbi:uncharacterized protein LOC128169118 [Crassostrea angulata]|uniref:uncharacterized protein LOC128169118 n=1 Tax=Magallana angulata TaxID=2784310 RepID=UPI0022B0B441|nr:uncharacterized protein LOC128169118 [Crassostrea angulata]